jgi:hypothetical protein
MDKEKLKSSVKKTFKKVGNAANKVFDITYKEFSYYTSVESFKVIKSPYVDDIKKTMLGFVDQDLKIIYIKVDDLLLDKKNLSKGSVVKLKDKTLFEVKDVDYSKTYDYLVKKHKKYSAINCYKIYLKAMFE